MSSPRLSCMKKKKKVFLTKKLQLTSNSMQIIIIIIGIIELVCIYIYIYWQQKRTKETLHACMMRTEKYICWLEIPRKSCFVLE